MPTKKKHRQDSFAGGEISSDFYGSQTKRRMQGLKECTNWIPTPVGGLINRAGFQWLGATAIQTSSAILVPFLYDSTNRGYVLEIYLDTTLKFRVWYNASLVVSSAVTMVGFTSLSGLNWFQVGDTIIFTQSGTKPGVVTRANHNSFTYAQYDHIRENRGATTDPRNGVTADEVNTGDPQRWRYIITAVTADGIESGYLFFAATGTNPFTRSAATPVVVTWDAPTTGAPYQYNIYCGVSNTHWGYLGSTSWGASQTRRFDDYGGEPDYSIPPPFEVSPFSNRAGGSDNYPATACIFQQRFWWGGGPQDEYMTRLLASKTGDFLGYDRPFPGDLADDSPLRLDMESRIRTHIKAIVPMGSLLVFTNAAEYILRAGAGGPVTPTSVEVKPQSFHGIGTLPPLTVNNRVLFVPQSQTTVRDISYDFESDSWRGRDLSKFAKHVLPGDYGIKSWTYTETPVPVVWMVRSDGAMYGLTYEPDIEMFAWFKVTTPLDGQFVAVAAVPEPTINGSRDSLYVYVWRNYSNGAAFTIERMWPRDLVGLAEFEAFLDSSQRVDGVAIAGFTISSQVSAGYGAVASGATTITLIADAGWSVGETGTATCSANRFQNPVGTDLDDYIVLDPFGDDGVGPIRVKMTSTLSQSVAFVTFIDAIPVAFQGVAEDNWAFKRTTFEVGHSNFDGATDVYAWADGQFFGPCAVSGGTLTLPTKQGLPRYAFRLTFGLLYDPQIELLDIPGDPTTKKTLSAIYLECNTSQGIKVGPTAAEFTTAPTDTSGNVRILVRDNWAKDGRVLIQQSQARKTEIRGVTRVYLEGGDG